jgi:hypothetical protein
MTDRALSANTVAKYSADWIREAVKAKGATYLENHDCSLCGVSVGYNFLPQDAVAALGCEVTFRSACGCSWSPDRPASYEDIADWLAMQSKDEIRDRIMEGLK